MISRCFHPSRRTRYPWSNRPARLAGIGRLVLVFLALSWSSPVRGAEWPLRDLFAIGGLFQDFQNYASVPYFHGGMDLRAPAGTPVYSPVQGRVRVNRYKIDASNAPRKFAYSREPFSGVPPAGPTVPKDWARYLEIAITDAEGRNWMIRHIDPLSVPMKIRHYAERGEMLPQGEKLGTIVSWGVAVIPQKGSYDHVHFEVTDAKGNFLNPLLLLPPREDTLPPQIGGIWFCANESGDAFPSERGIPKVSGEVDLIAEISDLADNLGYLLAPYRVSYWLDLQTENGFSTVRPVTEVVHFDRLPIAEDRTQNATVLYKEKLKTTDGTVESQGNALKRRFLYVLTNGSSFAGFKAMRCLETRLLKNGRYRLTVEAFDLAGNTTRREQLFDVAN